MLLMQTSGVARARKCQADVRALPFAPGASRYVYCLGVLPPDRTETVRALANKLCPGGWSSASLFRPVASLFETKSLTPPTTRMPAERAFGEV